MAARGAGLALVLLAAPAAAWAPQRSLAAGSYAQLARVMRPADRCGFTAYRIAAGAGGTKLLFLEGGEGSTACIEEWLRRSAHRLGMSPRFYGDDYSH